jgi:hypothetical protein
MGNPTAFTDDSARGLREAEVPDANFVNGMNLGGSCAPGLGINAEEGAVVGTPEQFTLLDQNQLARAGQRSQFIGGYPYSDFANVYPLSGGAGGPPNGTQPDAVIYIGSAPTQAQKDADPSLDGTLTNLGAATLTDLAVGWVAVL